MDRMYAPWRDKYVTKDTKKKKHKTGTKKDCVFCTQLEAKKDDTYFVIKRFKYCFVMMNYYPYNVGHVMVLPYAHEGSIEVLDAKTRAEMMEAVNAAVTVMNKELKPEGFNIGMNLGLAGGGGIPSHIHIHVLPRWRGDTNFMETLSSTKLLSVDFKETFQKLKKGFSLIKI